MSCSENIFQSVNLLVIKYQFDTKKNPWAALCSHCLANDSYNNFTHDCLPCSFGTKTSWHIAGGN